MYSDETFSRGANFLIHHREWVGILMHKIEKIPRENVPGGEKTIYSKN